MNWFRRTLRINDSPKGEDVRALQEALNREGAKPQLRVDGRYGKKTQEAVVYFQSTHLGQDGIFLRPDGVVGPLTAWAVDNPSGREQRSGYRQKVADVTDGIPAERAALIRAALAAHRAPTREIPDGSNWGDGVSAILANAGGPRPWCMHAYSHWYQIATGSYPLGRDHGHVVTFHRSAQKKGLVHHRHSGYEPLPGDCGIIAFRRRDGKLTGSGHAFVHLGTDRADSAVAQTVEGNAGNRVKIGTRNRYDPAFLGWVNLWHDEFDPGRIDVRGSDLTYAGTR